MVLTFKSSVPEQRVIIEKNADGRERISVATTTDGRNWNCRTTHPDGAQWEYRHVGPDPVPTMSAQMEETRRRYQAAKYRGDRPEQRMQFDRNRSINEAVSPVIPAGRR
jgi:hypothetical protein